MKKINWGKILLCAVIFLVIGFIIRQVELIFTMKYYLMPEYFAVWSKAMMPKAGPPPPEFMALSSGVTLVTGGLLAFLYLMTEGLLGKGGNRVIKFTVLIAVISLVFAYLPMYMLINLPVTLLVFWFTTGVVSVFLSSLVFTRILK